MSESRGPVCAGCFQPVKGNWRNDPNLVKVVTKAGDETTKHLRATDPGQFGTGLLGLDDVLEFQQQVIGFGLMLSWIENGRSAGEKRINISLLV